jgi:hypothetical protein
MINIREINKFVNELEEHIFNTSKKYLKILKNRENSKNLWTKEDLSMVMSFGVIEDLRTILLLDSIKVKERYINYILRGLVEQVIEYKYLSSNENLIQEYFGSKINNEDESGIFNPVKELKKLGGDRFDNGRERIRKMAKSIGQDLSDDNSLSLYDIFCITSEEVHNSYFQGYLDRFEDKEDEETFTRFHIIMLYRIIDEFLKTYDCI